jgi:hypothetical protein
VELLRRCDFPVIRTARLHQIAGRPDSHLPDRYDTGDGGRWNRFGHGGADGAARFVADNPAGLQHRRPACAAALAVGARPVVAATHWIAAGDLSPG